MPVPQPSAWTRSASCWFCASLSLPADATLRILPRSGRIACEGRSRACLGGPPHPEVEKLGGLHRIAGEPMIERVLDRLLDDSLRLGGGEAILGLALEF